MPDDLPQPTIQAPPPATAPPPPVVPPPVTEPTLPAPPALLPPAKESKKIKIGLAVLVLFLISVSLPMAVWLTKQRQEIRKQAAGEGQVICMPIDDSGNITNDKYRYKRLKIINNYTTALPFYVQHNYCNYSGSIGPGYVCNDYYSRQEVSINSGETRIFELNPPPPENGNLCVGQLDVGHVSPPYSPDCWNTTDNNVWVGGVAFTIYRNPSCPVTPTSTPNPTATPKPTDTPKPTATATAKPTPTGTLKPTNTPTATPRLSPTPTNTPRPTPTNTPKPTATGTVKPTPTNTPRLTPTPTPPGYFAVCVVSQAYDTDWNQITNLANIQPSQTVYFATQGSTNHPQGITKARLRINGGVWQETTNKHGDLFYIQYTIPSSRSYTVESMVYNPVLGWY